MISPRRINLPKIAIHGAIPFGNLVPFAGQKLDIYGKVALISGAGQGIGLALARELYTQGARLALIDINAETLGAAMTQFNRAQVMTLEADVRDRTAMALAVQQVIDRFGQLDVVVANAGVTPAPATMGTVDMDDFDRVIAINQTGAVNTVRPALEQIIANNGHVVIVCSCAAFSPGVGGAAYMMSKAAAEKFGRALRLELAAHGATAGVAYFGFVDTELARATLDEDPYGARLGHMLPWPLNQRISAEQAGHVLAEAIRHRAASTIAPRQWLPYSLMRGVLNVLIDRRLVGDMRMHALLHDIEAADARLQ